MHTYLGVDLTEPHKPTDCALLDEDLRVLCLGAPVGDIQLLALVQAHQPAIIAIDAPLGYPSGWQCLDTPCSCGKCIDAGAAKRRETERLVSAQGISLYPTTRAATFFKPVIDRGVRLRRQLEPDYEVLEVYPYGSKRRLWGKQLPKKSSAEGRRWFDAKLRELIPGLQEHPALLTHDQLDALVAAYTAYLYDFEQAEVLGVAEEGQIVLPLAVS